MITCLECNVKMTREAFAYGHDCEFDSHEHRPEVSE
jgi:hypothetical protein